MKWARLLAAVSVVTVSLTGCTTRELPTYAQVRAETLDVLQEVADLVPDPKEIVRTAEFAPYPCDDELALGDQPGVFFTGQWKVFVDQQFDVARFVRSVPTLMGDSWKEDPLGLPLSFAQVRLVRDSPRMSLTVEESVPGDRKAVELLAISRCGLDPETRF